MAADLPGSDPRPAPAPESLAPPDTVADLRADLEPPLMSSPVAEVVPLLVKAVGMLPPDERDQVYGWLLERGIGGTFGSPGPVVARRMRSGILSLQASGVLPPSHPTGQQVVPIRFPADQHAALRGWCAEHGFSMATVIRGLVSRFLDGQLRAQGD